MYVGIAWCFIKYRELETEPQTPTTLLETFLYQKNTYLALGHYAIESLYCTELT